MDFVVRRASKSEFAVALDWAAAEGWNPALGDLEAFFRTGVTGFVRAWIGPGDTGERKTLVARADGDIAGYATIRECRSGFKTGPLFAQNPQVAKALFSGLCALVPTGSPVSLDVHEANQPGVAMATGFGLDPVFEAARMYRGTAPQLPVSKIFGITTFELG